MDLGLKTGKALLPVPARPCKACAKALAGEGARVSSVRANVGRAQAGGGGDWAAGYSAADVSRPDEVKRVVAEAIAALGGPIASFTNAGGPPTVAFPKRPAMAIWDIAYQHEPDEN